jgi:potassium voltage-gated channel Shaker-related subfamily A protein 10
MYGLINKTKLKTNPSINKISINTQNNYKKVINNTNDKNYKRIRINIAGRIFEIYDFILQNYPQSLLGNKQKRSIHYIKSQNEYYFDRNGEAFEGIIYFYQTGGIYRCPMFVNSEIFYDEIKFFGLDEYLKTDKIFDDIIFAVNEDKTSINYMNNFGRDTDDDLPSNKYKKYVWQILEQPNKSTFGRFIAFICIATVILSIITICLETVIEANIKPQFYKDSRDFTFEQYSDTDLFNAFTSLLKYEYNNKSISTQLSLLLSTERKIEFFIIEFVCNSIFTIEIILRLIVTKQKIKLLKGFSNIIDIIAIMPFWIILCLNYLPFFISNNDKTQFNQYGLSILKVLRLTRILRILKLSRHIRVLNIMGKILYECIPEIILLLTFLAVNIVIFSSFIYYIELDSLGEKSQFISIPHSFWWAIISFTTVGYGMFIRSYS